MKKLAIALFAGFILAGCADKKEDQKTILDDILKVHDNVMGLDEQLSKNKTAIDTLIKQGKAPNPDTAAMLSKQLDVADNAMGNWMHDFEPDHKGKTDDDNLNYMKAQKKQIMAVDSQINVAIKASSLYLNNIKKK